MNLEEIIEHHLERDFRPYNSGDVSEEAYIEALMEHYQGYEAFVLKSGNDDNAGFATRWCIDKFGWNTPECKIGLGVWCFKNPKDAVEFKLRWCGDV